MVKDQRGGNSVAAGWDSSCCVGSSVHPRLLAWWHSGWPWSSLLLNTCGSEQFHSGWAEVNSQPLFFHSTHLERGERLSESARGSSSMLMLIYELQSQTLLCSADSYYLVCVWEILVQETTVVVRSEAVLSARWVQSDLQNILSNHGVGKSEQVRRRGCCEFRN